MQRIYPALYLALEGDLSCTDMVLYDVSNEEMTRVSKLVPISGTTGSRHWNTWCQPLEHLVPTIGTHGTTYWNRVKNTGYDAMYGAGYSAGYSAG